MSRLRIISKNLMHHFTIIRFTNESYPPKYINASDQKCWSNKEILLPGTTEVESTNTAKTGVEQSLDSGFHPEIWCYVITKTNSDTKSIVVV